MKDVHCPAVATLCGTFETYCGAYNMFLIVSKFSIPSKMLKVVVYINLLYGQDVATYTKIWVKSYIYI